MALLDASVPGPFGKLGRDLLVPDRDRFVCSGQELSQPAMERPELVARQSRERRFSTISNTHRISNRTDVSVVTRAICSMKLRSCCTPLSLNPHEVTQRLLDLVAGVDELRSSNSGDRSPVD